jgi:perosamine synthetase
MAVLGFSAARSEEVFRRAVQTNFGFLKRTASFEDLLAKSIPLPAREGCLVPICELHATDQPLIEKLATWREENAFAYPTQFPVTVAGTATWLRRRLLEIEDRILFLVLDRHGYPIGHLGFANALSGQAVLEIDNVVRGDKNAEPGIMGSAMEALLNWAEETLGPRSIYLRVFSDNEHAVRFYRRLGFVDGPKTPLRRFCEDGRIEYRSLTDDDRREPDKYFLHMTFQPIRQVDQTRSILTAGPSISSREMSYVLDAVRYGWNSRWADYLNRFEASFAEYIGVKHAIATSSCTGALHLALAALGIGPGDEVIVPDITWVATANAVMYTGATPVFADIEPDSWCLDSASFDSLISERTKAVIPVHLYGHPARMDRIMEIAHRHGLCVVEDAAPAIGAEFQGRRVGSFGNFAAFSFQGAKLLVTGEGGMLLTDDDDLYRRAKTLWDQGRTPGTFWINELGWKYKMSNIQAALGLGQLERVDELIEAKRRIFSWYAENLKDVASVQLNRETSWGRSIYWMTSIVLNETTPLSRDALAAALKKRNIDTRPVFPPISRYPFWPRPQQPMPTATRLGDCAMNLPSGVCLRREQVDFVCQCIRELVI